MGEGEEVRGGNKRRVQVRKAARGSFGVAERQVFLDHLAACCNVTRAAAAAGVGVSTVYDARRRDPVFAAQWDEAIEAGYATLEALLIERAALGEGPGGGGYRRGADPILAQCAGDDTAGIALGRGRRIHPDPGARGRTLRDDAGRGLLRAGKVAGPGRRNGLGAHRADAGPRGGRAAGAGALTGTVNRLSPVRARA